MNPGARCPLRPSCSFLMSAFLFVVIATNSATLLSVAYLHSTAAATRLSHDLRTQMASKIQIQSEHLANSVAVVCTALSAVIPPEYIQEPVYTGDGRESGILRLAKALKDQWPLLSSVGFDSPHGCMFLATDLGQEVVVVDDDRTEENQFDYYLFEPRNYTAGPLLRSRTIDHSQFMTRHLTSTLGRTTTTTIQPLHAIVSRGTLTIAPTTWIVFAAVRPIFDSVGNLSHAFSAAVFGEDLAATVNSMHTSIGGIVILFESSGNIIACNQADSRLTPNGTILNLRQVSNPLISGSVRYLSEQYGELSALPNSLQATFTVGTEKVLLDVRKVESVYDLHWYVALVTPEDDILSEAKTGRIRAIQLSIGFVLCGFLLALYLGRSFAASMKCISEEMQEITRLELEHTRYPESCAFVREINDMQNSFDAMKSALVSFRKYVPQHVIQALLRTRTEAHLDLKATVCTVCFIDIVNFTALTEELPLKKVVQAVGEFFEECTTIISDSDGIVDKYIGDSIMAFWNSYEQPVENHECVAVTAVLSCQKKLQALRLKWLHEGLPQLCVCAGMQCGKVLMGNVGSKSRLNYTVMGDAVNLAARLQVLNREQGTTVLVGENLYESTKDTFVYGEVCTAKVKGFKQEIRAYEPLCVRYDTAPPTSE